MNTTAAPQRLIHRYGFHAALIVVSTTLILLGIVAVQVSRTPRYAHTGLVFVQSGFTANEEPELEPYFRLNRPDLSVVNESLKSISDHWHPGSTTMMIEVARFSRNPRAISEIFSLIETKTGQNFGTNFEKWRQWIWKQDYDPHPQYAKFKSTLYSKIDPRFSEYFRVTKDSKIRLDEIRWGGVVRDGIPPLKDPKMLAAADADYLADTDVVFGVELNSDARCYPKRILAWHEMFKDTIGGESVCGVY